MKIILQELEMLQRVLLVYFLEPLKVWIRIYNFQVQQLIQEKDNRPANPILGS